MNYLNCPPPPEDTRPRCAECDTLLHDDTGLCDECFDDLKSKIEDVMDELDALQDKYHKLTGGYFKRPLRLKERK